MNDNKALEALETLNTEIFMPTDESDAERKKAYTAIRSALTELAELKAAPNIQEAVLIPNANAKILILENELRTVKGELEEIKKRVLAQRLSRSISAREICIIDYILKGEPK